MALESTQPLTEISTRCISWGKGGRCVRLTTLPPSCALVMKSGNLNFLGPSGPLQAYNGTGLPLQYFYMLHNKSTNYSASFVVDLRIFVHSQFQPLKAQTSAALSYTLC
jgi:hypothetical protein